MNAREASESYADVWGLVMPHGVDLIATTRKMDQGDRKSWVVVVSLKRGPTVKTLRFATPINTAACGGILAAARTLANGSGRPPVNAVATAEESGPNPMRWLASASARLNDVRYCDPGARRLAAEILRAVELEDITPPSVRSYLNQAIILGWVGDWRSFEITVTSSRCATLAPYAPETGGIVEVYPFGPDLKSRMVAYAAVRNLARWVNHKPEVTRQEMEALCYVRRGA